MQRGHGILIGGAVLLVAGITLTAVWGTSFAGNFIESNTILGRTVISPGQSINLKTTVTQLDRPLTLTVGVDTTSMQPPPFDGVKLRENVTDPNGKVVSSQDFGSSLFTSIQPQTLGTYTATVTNVGRSAISLSGTTLGHFPFVGANGQPNIAAMSSQGLGEVILGGLMIVGGVVTLIVGGIVTAVDARSQHRHGAPTSTSEAGVTYRKD